MNGGSVLFLGPVSPVLSYLRTVERSVSQTEERVGWPWAWAITGSDWLVSYNYQHILPAAVLRVTPHHAINLHIALLPYNRGRHPNVWSHYDGTPGGVTLHEMDAGVDTGPILAQRRVVFGSRETLATSYALLQAEAYRLFVEWWPLVRSGHVAGLSQTPGAGSVHRGKDLARLQPLLTQGWDTPCEVLRRAGEEARRAK